MFNLVASIYLVFSTPSVDTIIGDFDTVEDCEEVAWSMERYLAGASVYCTETP